MIGKFLLSPGTRRKPVANGLRVLLPLGVAALAAAGAVPGGLAVKGHRAEAPADVGPAAPATSPSHDADERSRKVDTAVRRGVDFLLASQNKDGSWGTGTVTRGFEIMSSVPGSHDGFRAATTALCVMALREAGESTAHDKGVQFLIRQGDAKRSDGPLLYNTWGNIYVTEALAIEIEHCTDEQFKQQLIKAADLQIHRLEQYETYVGGWNYYDFVAQTEKPSMGPTSFGTAAGLIALWEARHAGLTVPQKMIDRATHRLREMRLPNGAYLYGADYKYIPRLPANQPKGALGRDQPCNLALWMWNDSKIDEPKVREGLEYFFQEHEFIEMGRQRQFPHESWYQTAPYYYYYDHYYAARLIERLDGNTRIRLGKELLDVGILPFQESDGSWWDYAMWDYHKPYGTAFAIMTLLRCK